ncbi:MAG: hypothetical protein MUC96_15040 [Myxococcaceae bacterium]|nr:hypothetical protein [Myxococcaceae bacterium]
MTTARATPHTRFADRVLEPGLVREPSCALDSTAALLSSLSRRRLVAVECEADDDFLLGRIISVDQTTAVVHAIDARGRWARHATRLELDDVTRVQRCHYERCFERHGDPWPGRPGDVRRRSTQA